MRLQGSYDAVAFHGTNFAQTPTRRQPPVVAHYARLHYRGLRRPGQPQSASVPATGTCSCAALVKRGAWLAAGRRGEYGSRKRRDLWLSLERGRGKCAVCARIEADG